VKSAPATIKRPAAIAEVSSAGFPSAKNVAPEKFQ
jgi:hypothetical protein